MFKKLVFLCGILLMTLPLAAQTSEEFTGYMGDDVPDDVYPFNVTAGQTFTLTLEATSGNLDTYLILLDPSGTPVAENDDVEFGNLNSEIVYTAPTDGEYDVVVSNIAQTSGEYRLVVEISAPPEAFEAQAAPDETDAEDQVMIYSGYMGDDVSDEVYPVYLEANQGLIVTAQATDVGALDTYVIIQDEQGETLSLNDDREFGNTNSQAFYVAPTAGTVNVIMTNFPGTSGEYTLEIRLTDAQTVEAQSREQLSGPVQVRDTENFRIHYTLEGDDAATEAYIERVAETIEAVYQVQINELGWPLPPSDGNRGGDDRMDVYITNLLSEFEGTELGFASQEYPPGDNPNTIAVETNAVPGYLVLDNDYDLGNSDADARRILRATAAHELHHVLQFGFDQSEPHGWYYEATSTYMETITLPPDQDATGYMQSIFDYPEICFGAQGDADPTGGQLMYGWWSFMDMLENLIGPDFLLDLWAEIAIAERWTPLETILANNDLTLNDVITRYHVNNLARNYALADEMENWTVWVENDINAPGEYTYRGLGIQELGANYFNLATDQAYRFALADTTEIPIVLLGVGIVDDTASVYVINDGETFDPTPYTHAHVIAINTAYDDDLSACNYADYSITVSAGDAAPNTAQYQIAAGNYIPPEMR